MKPVINTDFIEYIMAGSPYKAASAKIMITRRCNSRCRKCPCWRRGSGEEMPPDKLIKIIDDISSVGFKKLNLIGGEVTLYKNLPEVLAYAHDKDIKCSITTNGFNIDKNYIKKFTKVRLRQAALSLDSHDPATHDYIVGIKSAWHKTVRAIRLLKNLTPRQVRAVGLNFVVTSMNYKHMPDYIAFAQVEGIDTIRFMPYERTGFVENDQEFALSPENIFDMNKTVIPECMSALSASNIESNIERIAQSIDMCEQSYFLENNELQVKTPCFLPFFRIDINHDGNVFPCCMLKYDQYLFGNVFDSSLSSIIDSKKSIDFKCGLIPPIKHPECSKCWIALDENVEVMKYVDKKHLEAFWNELNLKAQRAAKDSGA
ncbi:MAG: radical SAM protein [Deltaproteobacteria bacterium]|nr:radical SAM protein [Deltaproteobacteria bacterium]